MVEALFHFFNSMGTEWILWSLLFLSVATVAVIMERYYVLQKQAKLSNYLWQEEIDHWNNETILDPEKAEKLANSYPCVEARLLKKLIDNPSTTESKERVAVSVLELEGIRLKRGLNFLGTIGSNAPFIGLFGTVLGIIKAFHDLGMLEGDLQAKTISVGLAEALVATAAGLLVAIPAVIAFNFYQRKVQQIISKANSLTNLYLSRG